jgi:hypothetical protein
MTVLRAASSGLYKRSFDCLPRARRWPPDEAWTRGFRAD